MTTQIDEFLQTYNDTVHAIAQATRLLVKEVIPVATELFYEGYNTIYYQIGANAARKVIYIEPYQEHVNLRFSYGTLLPDPEGLLQGISKQRRHVKLASVEDVARPAVRALLEAAYAFETA